MLDLKEIPQFKMPDTVERDGNCLYTYFTVSPIEFKYAIDANTMVDSMKKRQDYELGQSILSIISDGRHYKVVVQDWLVVQDGTIDGKHSDDGRYTMHAQDTSNIVYRKGVSWSLSDPTQALVGEIVDVCGFLPYKNTTFYNDAFNSITYSDMNGNIMEFKRDKSYAVRIR